MAEISDPYKKTTILFPMQRSSVFLGMKKRGFGEGWWNGLGGKLEDGESYEDAAIRETKEEIGINIKALSHVANLHFYFNDILGVVSKAYTSKHFDGKPVETDEMHPATFEIDKLPYDTMWPADRFWIPSALKTTKPLGFIVHFDDKKNFKHIEEVDPTGLEDKF